MEEAGARDCPHAHQPRQILAEAQVAVVAELRHVQQYIVRALGVGVANAQLVQPPEEQRALAGIGVLKRPVVIVPQGQPGHGGLLQGRGCANSQEVMHLPGHVHNLRRGDDVPQPPAGDGVGFRQGGAADGALPHAGQGGHVHMLMGRVDDMLVHLVGDDIGVVLFRQVGNDIQLRPGEDLAAGVGGVAEDQRLGPLAEGVLQHLRVEAEVRRRQRHIDGLRAAEDGVRAVVLVEGGEHGHPVPGIGDGHHGGHHGLGGAAGDHDLAVRVDGHAHEAALLAGQGLAEVLRAPGDGILMGAVMGHPGQGVQKWRGRVEVREPLGQVHRAVLEGDAGHPADDGIGKAGGALGELPHGQSSSIRLRIAAGRPQQ